MVRGVKQRDVMPSRRARGAHRGGPGGTDARTTVGGGVVGGAVTALDGIGDDVGRDADLDRDLRLAEGAPGGVVSDRLDAVSQSFGREREHRRLLAASGHLAAM